MVENVGKVKTFFWNQPLLYEAHRWWRKEKKAKFRGLFAIGHREAYRTGDLRAARRQKCMAPEFPLSGFLRESPCFTDRPLLHPISDFVQTKLGFDEKTKNFFRFFSFLSTNRIKLYSSCTLFFCFVVELGIWDWFGAEDGFFFWCQKNDVVLRLSFFFSFTTRICQISHSKI